MTRYMTSRTKRLHFVGIGGIGMSGIAEFLHNHGYEITGSDMQLSDVTAHLSDIGIKIYEGHHPENLSDVDVVVKSSAVKDDNPEVAAAIAKKITVIRRAEMLAELMRMSYGIAIAGTHGKTTTTSMVGMVLSAADFDPTVIVGGKVMNYGTNSLQGSGDYIVVEADEYDRSFLSLSPIISAITNIEADHLDCYESIDDIKNAFITFANKVPFFGTVICCLDDPGVQSILPSIKKNIITYGFTRQADVRAVPVQTQHPSSDAKHTTSFDLLYKDFRLGTINLQTIGNHNIQNALLAACVGIELDIPFEQIKKGLEDFKGVYRRMEYIGKAQDIIVYDDYAHHHTEVQATLNGLRDSIAQPPNAPHRIVAVFQPHLYSRTRDFATEFGRAFYNADILILAPIYPAREKAIEGVTSQLIADAAVQSGHHNVICIDDKEKIMETIKNELKSGDILITMGAGDIHKYGKAIFNDLQADDPLTSTD